MAVPGISQYSLKSLMIRMYFGETMLATGTGFLYQLESNTLLFTNRHNFTGRDNDTGKILSSHGGVPDRIEIQYTSSKGLGRWVRVFEELYDNDAPRWLEHPTFGSKIDVVGLPLTNLNCVKTLPYTQIDDTPLRVGITDWVSVIGFPLGISVSEGLPLWVSGTIASEPQIDFEDLPLFLIDCRTRRGQSGSPVLAYRLSGLVPLDGHDRFTHAQYNQPVGRILGIYSGRINSDSDLGKVWKISCVQDILKSLNSD